MSDFKVKPAALRAYASLLSDNADAEAGYSYQALIDAEEYVETWIELPDGDTGLLFNELTSRTASIAQKLGQDYSSVNTALIESAIGLTTSADAYTSTEAANNAAADAVYGDVTPTAMPDADGAGTGSSAPVPRSELTTPGDEAGIPDFVNYVMQPTGLLSPSGWILKLLGIFNINPVEWSTEKLTGNLDAVAHVKNALECLSAFDTTMSNGISAGTSTMLRDWAGHAADGCADYMAKLADALDSHATQLDHLSNNYNEFAVTIQQFGSALESLLGIFVDKLTVAAALVAGAGCLAAVPGIDLITALIGAEKVYECYKAWEEVTKAFDIVMTSAHGVIAITTGMASSLESYHIADDLPSMGYYNGAQGPAPDYNAPDTPARGGAQVPR